MSDFDPDAHLAGGESDVSFDPDAHLGSDSHRHGSGKSYDVVDGKLVPTGSPEAHAAQSPTNGMSNYDLAMAGAGKAQYDIKRGVQQLIGTKGIQGEIDSAASQDKALMGTVPGAGGYIGGSIADMVIPVGMAGKAAQAAGLARTGAALTSIANPAGYGAAAASGALQGALQPVETGGSRTLNTAGGAAGGLIGNAAVRVGGELTGMAADKLGDSASRAVKALTEAGVPLDAAQRTGSMLWNRAKIMLGDNPLTAGAQRDFADLQQKAINKAFLSTVGETANAATPDVMSRAMKRLGDTYDGIASRTQIPYDNVEEPLSHVLNNARLTLNDAQFGVISRNVDDILNKASQNGGHINGEQFQNIKKTMDRLSAGGDSDVAEVARDIRQTMNDGLLKSAQDAGNDADVQLLKKTNQQWRNMRTIEGAIDKQGSGDISPARMATIMNQKANRSVSIYGKGDTSLSDLAQSANELLTSHTPNSGTPLRLATQAAIPIALGAGYEGMKEGNWEGAAKGAAAGYAIPKGAQLLLNHQGLGTATNALGSLGKKASMPLAAGGAVQHLPTAAEQALMAPYRKESEGK